MKSFSLVRMALNFVFAMVVLLSAVPVAQAQCRWGLNHGAQLRNINRPDNVRSLPGGVYRVRFDEKCKCGIPKVAVGAVSVKQGYPAKISITLRGHACDGSVAEGKYMATRVLPGEWDTGSANVAFFKDDNLMVLRVEVEYFDAEFQATYRYITDYESGQDETYINDRPWEEVLQEEAAKAAREQKEKEAQVKAGQEQLRQKQEAAQQAAVQQRQESQADEYRRVQAEAAEKQRIRNQITQGRQQVQQQTSQTIQNSVQQGTDAVANYANFLAAESEKKEQARQQQQEWRQAQEEERQQQLRARQQREEQEEQQRRLAAEEERLRREQERERQQSITAKILGNYNIQKKASEAEANVARLYYVTYERNYATNKVTVKTYTLNRYSDDTWMMQNDLLKKIVFSIYENESGEARLLGGFSSKETALAAIAYIRANSDASVDSSFLEANSSTTRGAAAGSDKDFWNK